MHSPGTGILPGTGRVISALGRRAGGWGGNAGPSAEFPGRGEGGSGERGEGPEGRRWSLNFLPDKRLFPDTRSSYCMGGSGRMPINPFRPKCHHILCWSHPSIIQVYIVLEVVSDSLASVLQSAAWACRMHAAAYGLGVRLMLMISRSKAQTQVSAI